MEQNIERIFNGLTQGIIQVLSFLSSLFDNKERKTEYDADFIPETNLLSKKHTGFCLTGIRSISAHHSYSHALVLGGSSSGKSSNILIPSILKMASGNSSLVINDPSSELYIRTSGYLKSKGFKVISLNYATPRKSEGFNPVHRANNKEKLAKIIMDSSQGKGNGDPFWRISGEALLSFFLKYLEYEPSKYRTLANCLYLVNALSHSGTDEIAKHIVRTNDPELINEYKTLLSYGERTLSSVIATSRSALSFLDRDVSLVTSHDTFDFEAFRKEKTALFINNSVADMKYYGVITSVFFEQFWGELMGKLPSDDDLDIFFLIDEASSLYLGGLPTAINNLRKSRVGMMLIYQSYNQIVDMYGSSQAKNITANCFSRVYLPGQPIEVAKELELTLGKFEYLDDKEVRHIRSLMTADEIRTMSEALILCGNIRPIKTSLTPYFTNRTMNKQCSMAPVDIANKLPFEKAPLLLVDEKKEK